MIKTTLAILALIVLFSSSILASDLCDNATFFWGVKGNHKVLVIEWGDNKTVWIVDGDKSLQVKKCQYDWGNAYCDPIPLSKPGSSKTSLKEFIKSETPNKASN